MKHLPLRECGCAIGFLALLAGIYFGAYFCSIERTDVGKLLEFPGSPVHREAPFARYPYGNGKWGRAFFGPAHRFDQWIRPAFWADEFELEHWRDPIEHKTFNSIGGKEP